MLEVLDGFVAELRSAGLPIALRESIDAAQALSVLDLDDRASVKAALGATLVKTYEHWQVFSATFDVYFSIRKVVAIDEGGMAAFIGASESSTGSSSTVGQATNTEVLDAESVEQMVLEALQTGERRAREAAARAAVAHYGGVDASRPVGVSYYLHRAIRGIDLDNLLARLLANVGRDASGLEAHLVQDEYRANARALRGEIESEIARQLVDGRGSASVAKSLRTGLIEDVDFMHASAEELARLRKAVYPLARVLASRLAQRRRHRRQGHLDFKATVRKSLSAGGVPIEPRFRHPHVLRPEIVVLADVSGSVAAFARFTVHLVYALSAQFSKMRVMVFIDGVDEVTDILKRSATIAEALEKMSEGADVVAADGHSDYGNALSLFEERYGRAIGARTNVIILGDARSNYHTPRAEVLKRVHQRARRVYWLNPEPRSYWGSGDSIIDTYARFCDQVYECRNLRQLKAFVDELA